MSSATRPRPEPGEPAFLHKRAMKDLRYIRETMARAASFTAVPGWGGVGMGATGLVAAGIAARQPTPGRWLAVWVAAAAVATVIGGWTMIRKAREANATLLEGPGRQFMLSLLPPLAAGGLLTVALFRMGAVELLPAVWLLLYGTAVVTGGAFSIPTVPVLGFCFMATGLVALFTPAGWGNWFMAAGFGGLHVLFGVIIARRHGG